MSDDNESAYRRLLKRYCSLGFWGVYNAMVDDGYDPNCDYTTMLGVLEIADSAPPAAKDSEE